MMKRNCFLFFLCCCMASMYGMEHGNGESKYDPESVALHDIAINTILSMQIMMQQPQTLTYDALRQLSISGLRVTMRAEFEKFNNSIKYWKRTNDDLGQQVEKLKEQLLQAQQFSKKE